MALGGIPPGLDNDFKALAHLAVAVALHRRVAADPARVVVAAGGVVRDSVPASSKPNQVC